MKNSDKSILELTIEEVEARMLQSMVNIIGNGDGFLDSDWLKKKAKEDKKLEGIIRNDSSLSNRQLIGVVLTRVMESGYIENAATVALLTLEGFESDDKNDIKAQLILLKDLKNHDSSFNKSAAVLTILSFSAFAFVIAAPISIPGLISGGLIALTTAGYLIGLFLMAKSLIGNPRNLWCSDLVLSQYCKNDADIKSYVNNMITFIKDYKHLPKGVVDDKIFKSRLEQSKISDGLKVEPDAKTLPASGFLTSVLNGDLEILKAYK